MDNFDELDESVISSSGRKRKIKAETFSRNLAKAARYNDVPVFHSSTLERRGPVQSLPQQSLPPPPLPAQDMDSEMVEILI